MLSSDTVGSGADNALRTSLLQQTTSPKYSSYSFGLFGESWGGSMHLCEDLSRIGWAVVLLATFAQSPADAQSSSEWEILVRDSKAPSCVEFVSSAEVSSRRESILAAAKNDDAAANLISAMLADPRCKSGNAPTEAMVWYQRAAELGNVSAMNILAESFSTGTWVKKDEVAAAEWYLRAATGGHSGAMISLGWAYQAGRGVKPNLYRAVEWYERAAAGGSTSTMLRLGHIYWSGLGRVGLDRIDADPPRALQWYLRAAEAGDIAAMKLCGDILTTGRGRIPVDREAGLKWWRKAAEVGDLDTILEIANKMSPHGTHPGLDRSYALTLYERAAALGSPFAMFRMGNRAKSEASQIDWYQKAASAGYAPANTKLGDLYFNGYWGRVDDKLAAYWFKKGAEAGDSESMTRYAWSLEWGLGVPRDLGLAKGWYRSALAAGANVSRDLKYVGMGKLSSDRRSRTSLPFEPYTGLTFDQCMATQSEWAKEGGEAYSACSRYPRY